MSELTAGWPPQLTLCDRDYPRELELLAAVGRARVWHEYLYREMWSQRDQLPEGLYQATCDIVDTMYAQAIAAWEGAGNE